MGKPKILEINKKLNAYVQDVMNDVIHTQSEAQSQLKEAKLLEIELISRIRGREERKLLEREAEERALQQQEAKAQAAAQEAVAEKPQEQEVQKAAVAEAQKTETPDVQAQQAEEKQVAPEMPVAPKEEVEAASVQTVQEETKQDVPPQEESRPVESSAVAEPPKAQEPERTQEPTRPGTERSPRSQGERTGQNTRQQSDRTYLNNRQPGDRPYAANRQQGDRSYQNNRPQGDRSYQSRPQGEKPFERNAKPSFSQMAKPGAATGGRSYDARKKKTDEEMASKRRRSAIKEKGIFQEDEFPRGSKKGRKKDRQQKPVFIEPIKIEKAVITGDTISVKLFAEKTGKPVAEIIKKLMLLGMMCTINSEIDFDTASLVADEFGIELEQKFEQTAEDVLIAEDKEDAEEDLVPRPPVVTIMGHVDHGKTSLLDAIRKTKVQAGEAGGITQHIGAYTIEIDGRSITFLDTPGHEAFTAMRARGAQATDIAILVVAADDGVMPQTVEAINHAKSANVPIIVAINKIDKEGADVERIKQSLTEYELVAEEWGGDTVMVPVSAVTGEGLSNLLEMILLVADVQELKANPNRLAKGTIIEARLDKGRGPVATVLVQNGTLKVHDTVVAGTAYGRIRAMLDDSGKPVKKAGPSTPVEIIGFSEVPEAGDVIYAVEQDKLSKQVAEERRDKIKAEKLKAMNKVSLDDLFNQIAEGQIQDLNLIVKADVQGSVEAVTQSLEKLSGDEVRVRVIHGGVGAIRESDVMLASASNAIIIGFNVRPDAMVAAAAEREKVDIRLYRVIYNAIEDITKAMKGMLAPEFEESLLGHAEVRQTFKVSSVGTIAGCYVQDGKMVRNASIRLLRDGIVVHEGKLSSLKRCKDDAKEVAAGYECGLTIESFNDIKEGDVVEAYEMVEIAR